MKKQQEQGVITGEQSDHFNQKLALWDAFVMLFTDPLQFPDNLKGEIKDQPNALTSNAVSHSSLQVSQHTDVQTNNIEFQVQAIGAKGIAQVIPGSLKDSTWHFNDGLRA